METENAKQAAQSVERKHLLQCCALSIALCALGFRFAVAEHRPSNAALRAFNEGVKAFNDREFQRAIPYFDQAISADSEFAEAYFARGACKHHLQMLDSAMMDLSDTLRLKPDYLEARSLRGAIHYDSDRWDAAMDDFNYVLTRNPKDAQSLLGRAVIHLKREQLEAAAHDFRNFIKVRPEDPLVPRVREVLASLERKEPRATRENAGTGEEQASPRAARAGSSARASGPSASEIQKMADTLLSHPVSDAYTRKMMRGERAQAVGDIRHETGVTVVEPR